MGYTLYIGVGVPGALLGQTTKYHHQSQVQTTNLEDNKNRLIWTMISWSYFEKDTNIKVMADLISSHYRKKMLYYYERGL